MRIGVLLVVGCNRGPSQAHGVGAQPSLYTAPARTPASADASALPKPSDSHAFALSVVEPAAFYAALFEQGKQWSFSAEVRLQSPSTEGQRPKIKTHHGTLVCEVKHVERSLQAHVALVECDGPSIPQHPDTPAGTYVATADGLWRVEQVPRAPDDLAKLSPNDRLLARWPRAGERKVSPADSSDCEQWQKTHVFRDGFCVSEGTACGDEGGFTLCFSQSRGLIGGSAYFGGGSTYDLRYGDAPHDP